MPNLPQLLIDSDAFCKLAAAELLDDVLSVFACTRTQCARLPALPHMLRRGRLRSQYGEAQADAIVAIAQAVPELPEAESEWLDPLVSRPGIDFGEAQIYALAAQHGIRVLTGDKRALADLVQVPKVSARLGGFIATLEIPLRSLADSLAPATFAARMHTLAQHDSAIRAIYGTSGAALAQGLDSYIANSVQAANPMKLWKP